MRQVHRAGEKTFTDYSGKKPSIVDRITGEATPVELFVKSAESFFALIKRGMYGTFHAVSPKNLHRYRQ